MKENLLISRVEGYTKPFVEEKVDVCPKKGSVHGLSKLHLCMFLLLIFSACTTKTKDVSEYSVIDLREVIDKEAGVNLADEIADVKYIPLQVTSDDESLIGEIADYAVTSNYIYILSAEESRVIQFDREGNFIKTLIKSGPGPQEFTGLLSGMQADEENNKLYLFGSMIWEYSLDGEFINRHRTGEAPIMFERNIADGHFAAVAMAFVPFQAGSFGIGVFSDSGDLLFNKNDFYTSVVPPEKTGFTANFAATLSYDAHSLLFKTGSNDTIFRIAKDSIAVACVFNAQNSEEEIRRSSDVTDFSDISGLRRSGSEIYVQDMMETPSKFYFRCGYKQGFRIVSVDKKTAEVSVEKCLQPASLQELAKTTLFHGMLGSRSYNNFPIWGRCVKNELIQVITPSELSLYSEMKDISIPSFLQNVGEDDNPMFIIYKLTY